MARESTIDFVKTLLFACLIFTACGAEKPATETVAATESAAPAPATTTTAPLKENETASTWSVQVKVDAHGTSTLNYVGAESGDWMPIRFRNDSEAGKKILAACGNDDLCEFTGVIEYLDEVPPDGASAVSQLIRVDSAKRLPPES
jgi:hypothetical protein